MSARDDEIRRVVAELDAHVAEVEAGIAVLKALLAHDGVPDREDLDFYLTNRGISPRSW